MSADIVQIGRVPKIIPHEIELGTAEAPVSGNINKQVTFVHELRDDGSETCHSMVCFFNT